MFVDIYIDDDGEDMFVDIYIDDDGEDNDGSHFSGPQSVPVSIHTPVHMPIRAHVRGIELGVGESSTVEITAEAAMFADSNDVCPADTNTRATCV